MENLKIIASTVSFKFELGSQLEIKRTELKEKLADEYPEFDEIPLPQNAPEELPRFVAASHHGYSNLLISTDSVQFSTRFDDLFNLDWKHKCRPYIEKHINSLSNYIFSYYKKMLYCGVTLTFIKNSIENSTVALAEKYIKKTVMPVPLYDVSMKQTFVQDNLYYANLSLQNQRIMPNGQQIPLSLLKKIEQTNLIGVTLDINDRYAANYDSDYISSITKFYHILDIATNVINEQIVNI